MRTLVVFIELCALAAGLIVSPPGSAGEANDPVPHRVRVAAVAGDSSALLSPFEHFAQMARKTNTVDFEVEFEVRSESGRIEYKTVIAATQGRRAKWLFSTDGDPSLAQFLDQGGAFTCDFMSAECLEVEGTLAGYWPFFQDWPPDLISAWDEMGAPTDLTEIPRRTVLARHARCFTFTPFSGLVLLCLDAEDGLPLIRAGGPLEAPIRTHTAVIVSPHPDPALFALPFPVTGSVSD